MAKSRGGAAVTPVSEESILVGVVEETTVTLDGNASFLDTQFQQLYTEGKFSDVTLVVGNIRFPAHKAILAMSSGYFQRLFFGGIWKESGGDEVKLKETSDCEQAFGTFLSYFYNGSVTLTRKTVVPVVTLADKYDVQGLKQMCSRFIAGFLHQKNALESALRWVTFAEHIRMPDLQKSCYDLICYNLEKVYKLPAWRLFSLKHLLNILKRPEIVVSDEYTVFLAAQTWFQCHSKASKDTISKVLSQRQFKNMTGDQLCQVEKSKLASFDAVKAHNLLAPYFYDSFKFVASPRAGDEAKMQRIYTKGSSLYTTLFYNGCSAELTPDLTHPGMLGINTIWHLRKEGKRYEIEMSMVETASYSRSSYGKSGKRFSNETHYIHFNLISIIRDKDGNTMEIFNGRHAIQEPHLYKVVLKYDNGQDQQDSTPYDVMYLLRD